MSKQKSDITKYSPSLGGKAQQYNEAILKTLALKGPNTSTGIATEIITLIKKGSFKTRIKRNDLISPAERYYAKKKLNSVIDRRLKELQGYSEEPRYVKAIEKTKGNKTYSEWELTFRGYVLSLIAFSEVQREWRNVFQLWRSVMPDYAKGLSEFMIKYKVTDNAHYIIVIEMMKYALKDGKLDVIDSDEITREVNFQMTLALDEMMNLLVSKKHKATNVPDNQIPAVLRKFRKLKKEDLNSVLRLFNDPTFKRDLAEETENFLTFEREKLSNLEKMTRRLRSLGK
jgi:hypothetical protein